jgi:hypothetical protein
LLDGVTLERQGMPTATIITDVFVVTAQAYTRMLGVPDFPYLVCRHPITSVGLADLEARARELAPGVRRLLTGGSTHGQMASSTRASR